MKRLRLFLSIVGLAIVVLIFGGLVAIMAYISGDAGILGALWAGIIGAFEFSWIFGVIFLLVLAMLIYGVYTGLRGGKKRGR